MEKFFNTAGPCNPARHYMLPALDRLPGIRRLVAMEQYFVIHAPRQTGKTTAVKAHLRNSPPRLLIIGNNSLKQLAFGARANSPAPIG